MLSLFISSTNKVLMKNYEDLKIQRWPPTSRHADSAFIRKFNTSLILNELRTSAPLSRGSLSITTGLNRSTVSNVINELLQKNYVIETGMQASSGGRPGTLLELNPNGGCAVSIEIGVNYIRAILTNFTAQILWRESYPYTSDNNPHTIFERIYCLTQDALDIGKSHGLPPLGIGIGVPGMVDYDKGELVFAPNLGWRDIPFSSELRKRFEIPVFVENEANASALGEYYFGIGRHVENLVYISTGIGLGTGIIIKGKLFRGSHGYAGEVGHMTVTPNGDICACGKRGCWETLVGPGAILKRVKTALEERTPSLIQDMVHNDLENLDMDIVTRAADAGDTLAKDTLEGVGYQLGVGISHLVHAFDPQMIVLGGGLSQLSAYILPVIEQTLQVNLLVQMRNSLTLATSTNKEDACVMGGVALVIDDILRELIL
jgi:glucokinase-like ROK family protein